MIDSEQLKQHMVKAVEEIRATNPMAGSITNTVTIDFVANAQLAVGGSAAMVYLPDEGEALVAGGGAIYLNMGTLFPIYEQTIPRAAKAAHDAGKPWVLDPVGLGIGSLRTQLVNELKQYKPAIVRGNASEIIALAGRSEPRAWCRYHRHGRRRPRCRRGARSPHRWRRCGLGRSRPNHRRHDGGQVSRRQPAHVQDHRLRLLAGRRAGRVCLRRRPVYGSRLRHRRLQRGRHACRRCRRRPGKL